MEASQTKGRNRSPAGGAYVPRDEAAQRGQAALAADVTCPGCGAGLDTTGGLGHEPFSALVPTGG
jgi:hypothetical protein